MEKRIIKGLTLFVVKDKSELAKVAGRQLRELARQARGRFLLALSGGKTPEILYREMAKPRFCRQFPWKKTHFFWSDERWVPKNHPRSNFRLVNKNLFRKIDLPEMNIHRIQTELESPNVAAHAYRKEIFKHVPVKKGIPIFDLILLGLGEDGHTASLFPNARLVQEKKHPVGVSRSKKEMRVGLTMPVLQRAKNLFFLVAGKEKAGILRRFLNQDPLPSRTTASLPSRTTAPLPAALAVKGRKKTIIYCDKAAFPP